VPTVGRIANGAIIEREVEFALNRLHQVRPALRNADFTTAKWIAAAINDFIGAPTAEPLDSSTVQINVPRQFTGNVVALLTEIEQLQIEPDLPAKIVIDERSGIIVMGRDEIARTIELVDSKIVNTDERGSGATAAAARMPPKMAPRTTTRAAIIRRTISLPIRMRAR